MPVKCRTPKHREQMHAAVQRGIDGLPVADTRANRNALVEAIWLRRFESNLTEDERDRAQSRPRLLRQVALPRCRVWVRMWVDTRSADPSQHSYAGTVNLSQAGPCS